MFASGSNSYTGSAVTAFCFSTASVLLCTGKKSCSLLPGFYAIEMVFQLSKKQWASLCARFLSGLWSCCLASELWVWIREIFANHNAYSRLVSTQSALACVPILSDVDLSVGFYIWKNATTGRKNCSFTALSGKSLCAIQLIKTPNPKSSWPNCFDGKKPCSWTPGQ